MAGEQLRLWFSNYCIIENVYMSDGGGIFPGQMFSSADHSHIRSNYFFGRGRLLEIDDDWQFIYNNYFDGSSNSGECIWFKQGADYCRFHDNYIEEQSSQGPLLRLECSNSSFIGNIVEDTSGGS